MDTEHSKCNFWAGSFLLALIWFGLAPSAIAQATVGSTSPGNTGSGKYVTYSYSYLKNYFEPGGVGYGTTPYSGFAIDIRRTLPTEGTPSTVIESYTGDNSKITSDLGPSSGNFTVPVGETWTFRVALRQVGAAWVTTETSYAGATGSYVAPGSTAKYLNYSITNTKDYAIKYVVFDKDGNVLETVTVPAGSTATGQVTYPSAAGPAVEKVFVPATFSDGGWVEADLDSGTGIPVTPPSTPGSYSGEPPETPITTIPLPPGMPSSGTAPSTGGVWVPSTDTVDTERLDKTTYKAGVDKQLAGMTKIEDALTKTTVTAPIMPADPASPTSGPADTLVMPDPSNLLPSVPGEFSGAFSSVTAISVNLTLSSMLGSPTIPMNWSYDFHEHDAIISMIRNLLAYILMLLFFVLCVKTARSAFV